MSKRRVERKLAGAALVFAALGDATRLALLERLSHGGPASISTLAQRFEVTRQGVTKHLHVLAEAGVIDGRREGREHVWALNPARLAEASRHLEVIARGWDGALARLQSHLDESGRGREAAPRTAPPIASGTFRCRRARHVCVRSTSGAPPSARR